MKVLVTGATGLLGSRLMKAFPAEWEVCGTYHSHPAPGLVELNLEDSHSIWQLIRGQGYDWVIHCAGLGSPDECEQAPRRAVEINAQGTEWLARAVAEAGARLAYASTSCVFRGDKPPYSETDVPSPANVYGHSKLAGERHALSVPGGLVIRMSALYSLDLRAPNNILGELWTALKDGGELQTDGEAIYYFTLAEEVAAAVVFLVMRSHHGVVNVSAREGRTKSQFLRAAAQAMGLNGLLVKEAPPGASGASKPKDARLSTRLYDSLGGPPLTDCSKALERLRSTT